MVEMAYGLQYKEDDHTTAIQFIDGQLETINSQAVYGQEQDQGPRAASWIRAKTFRGYNYYRRLLTLFSLSGPTQRCKEIQLIKHFIFLAPASAHPALKTKSLHQYSG